MATHRRRIVFIASIALLGAILFYPVWTYWDMHRLRRMCAELKPGAPVADIRPTVTKYGLGRFLINDDGLFDDRTQSWSIAIPAPSTMGDMACFIRHNRSVVLAAEIVGP